MKKNPQQSRIAGSRCSALGLAAALLATAACAHNSATMAKNARPSPQMAAKTETASLKTAAPKMETFAQLSQGLASHKFWGTVESWDAASSELEVKSKNGTVKAFSVLSDTELTRGGEDTAIPGSDLAKGDHVRVVYAGKYAGAVHVMVLPQNSGLASSK